MIEGLAVTAAISSGSYFLNKVLGPTLNEVGLMINDPIRRAREARLSTVASKAQAILDVRGHDAQPIPHRVLVPALEGASLEDDAGMQERWATLLANAADGQRAAGISPSFPHILTQLSPLEVAILDDVLRTCETSHEPPERWPKWHVVDTSERVAAGRQEYEVAVTNLFRHQLLSSPTTSLDFAKSSSMLQTVDVDRLRPTVLGVAFGLACWSQPPVVDVDEGGEWELRSVRGVASLFRGPLSEDLDDTIQDAIDSLDS